MITLYKGSYGWQVEFTLVEKKYTMNKMVTVICPTITIAMQEVRKHWPECTIIKVFRGMGWGNEGVIIATEQEA